MYNQRQRALNSKMIKKIIDELDVIDELAKEIGYLRTIVKEQSEDIDKMKNHVLQLGFVLTEEEEKIWKEWKDMHSEEEEEDENEEKTSSTTQKDE